MAGGEGVAEATAKKSDLGVRTLSAIVMITVAGTALWLGGWWWTTLLVIVAVGVVGEWTGLVTKFVRHKGWRAIWIASGIVYIGMAAGNLDWIVNERFGYFGAAFIILGVVGTDVGAYFLGRTVGGPKIAPSISPSKTWAGLVGGVLGAAIALLTLLILEGALESARVDGTSLVESLSDSLSRMDWGTGALESVVAGAVIAVVAQIGDFFESWMKRRAGVKDSGSLLPGHGGLLDRVDGLLAVSFVMYFVPWEFVLGSSGVP